MASNYYKRSRGQREAKFEETFRNGMFFSEGPLDDGYAKLLVNFDVNSDKGVLKARRYLRTSRVVMPNPAQIHSYGFWQAHEHYNFGYTEGTNSGRHIVALANKPIDGEMCTVGIVCDFLPPAPPEEEYEDAHNRQHHFTFRFNNDVLHTSEAIEFSTYTDHGLLNNFNIVVPEKFSIHGLPFEQHLDDDYITMCTIAGTFGPNSEYYYVSTYESVYGSTDNRLVCVNFNDPMDHTVLTPEVKDPKEAVTYGYNMLLDNPYTFNSVSGVEEILGILPYNGTSSSAELLMAPKVNQKVYMQATISADTANEYYFMWDYMTLGSDEWQVLRDVKKSYKYKLVSAGSGKYKWQAYYSSAWHDRKIYYAYAFPADAIIVRLQMFVKDDNNEFELVSAMSVGFDFSKESYKDNVNKTPINYNLCTATGMGYWNSRLVLWGVQEDETILWFSDYEEPKYFPYPNNIVTFDEPIVTVKNYLDDLLVFTKSKIYHVSLDETGVGFQTTLIQTNLHLQLWDLHLIQIIRNMVFFKSGNYYFMIVPKSTSTTGELTLAPISNNIKEFLDNFEVNVLDVLSNLYNITEDDLDENGIHDKLRHFYNFVNYNEVWNVYTFELNINEARYFNFVLVYNTETRTWCTHCFESDNILMVLENEATDYSELVSAQLHYTEYSPRSWYPDYSLGYYSGSAVDMEYDAVLRDSNGYIVDDILSLIPGTGPAPYGSFVKLPIGYVDGGSEDDEGIVFQTYYVAYNDMVFRDELVEHVELPFNRLPGGVNQNFRRLYFQVHTFNNELEYYIPEHNHVYESSDIQHLFRLTPEFDASYIFDDAFDEYLNLDMSFVDKWMVFKPWQFIDTGYFKDAVYYFKRFRELQFSITNTSDSDLIFNLYFDIDGNERLNYYRYVIQRDVDPESETYAQIWLEPIPLDIIKVKGKQTVLDEDFILDNSRFPEISLWKARVPVSGKGMSGRIKLLSKNIKRYELYSVNWIYRIMNLR